MDFSTLTTCRLFRGLSIEEIKTIIGNISCYIKHYEEGETVYHLMSKADRIGIILKGRVQAQKIIPNGNQFNFSVRQAGELLGPAAAFSDVRKYPFEVKAMETTDILTFERTGLLQMLQSDVRLMDNFISELASANFLLQQRLELLTYNAIQQKIAFYLLMASKESGKAAVSIPSSMTRWALMMNVSRPSLHRELKKMEGHDLIRYSPPVIEILDFDGLWQVLEE